MSFLTTHLVIAFRHPFVLGGYGVLPCGDYALLVEEELLRGESFQAPCRLATYLLVPIARGHTEIRLIDPDELKLALERDRSSGPEFRSDVAFPPGEAMA